MSSKAIDAITAYTASWMPLNRGIVRRNIVSVIDAVLVDIETGALSKGGRLDRLLVFGAVGDHRSVLLGFAVPMDESCGFEGERRVDGAQEIHRILQVFEDAQRDGPPLFPGLDAESVHEGGDCVVEQFQVILLNEHVPFQSAPVIHHGHIDIARFFLDDTAIHTQ